MSIKPLEKKKGLTLGANVKLVFLIFAVSLGIFISSIKSTAPQLKTKIQPAAVRQNVTNLAQSTVKEAQQTAAEVLGEATQIVQTTIDKTKDQVTDTVFKNTVVVFLNDLIQKLPSKQQEEVRKELCK